jgi:hypothetical protein
MIKINRYEIYSEIFEGYWQFARVVNITAHEIIIHALSLLSQIFFFYTNIMYNLGCALAQFNGTYYTKHTF